MNRNKRDTKLNFSLVLQLLVDINFFLLRDSDQKSENEQEKLLSSSE
jgi:hypothetical protein